MTDRHLPRVLYVADVAVESSHHGSALLYRALEHYPADRLLVVETGIASRIDRRLPGVRYVSLPIANRRWLNSQLHGAYSAWLDAAAPWHERRVRAETADFRPDAVLTVGHGFGWLTAAALATRLDVPLHLIVHDDWPRVAGCMAAARGWLDRRFADVYRRSRTRLCVSPYMAETYQRRYGVPATVMYPSRSSRCPTFPPTPARVISDADDLVIGYGGNVEIMSCLQDLATAVSGIKARVVLFGPFDDRARTQLLSLSAAQTFRGLVPFDQMITGLHETADLLFVPMSFDAAHRDNMSLSFPSKLTDYTATGLPLLIYAPPYASAARWAGHHRDIAEVVDEAGPQPLRQALVRLKSDPARRRQLAEKANRIGSEQFDASVARATLHTALLDAAGPATPAVTTAP